jgi:hypothetical protein
VWQMLSWGTSECFTKRKSGPRSTCMFSYHVDAFVPPALGCGKSDTGWDRARCSHFSAFLNAYAQKGWRLQSCEYRSVSAKDRCSSQKGVWLVCIFESGRA